MDAQAQDDGQSIISVSSAGWWPHALDEQSKCIVGGLVAIDCNRSVCWSFFGMTGGFMSVERT